MTADAIPSAPNESTIDPVLELLARWSELQEQGQSVSPESLCPDNPELLSRLQEKIIRQRRFAPLLDPAATLTDPQPAALIPIIPGYEIQEVLGRGGMGVVYKAWQPALGRSVAIKTIWSGSAANDSERRRFGAEAAAAAQLQHPHIVQVFEVGEQDRCQYLVLELVSGGSLADQLTGTPMTELRAATLIQTLAKAVAAAHEKGIVHRDLKPANVLLAPDGTPKITDFGLAKRMDATQGYTLPGSIFGSPSYMSPEQASGGGTRVGPQVDVYGLGAILYELLTGRPPFRAATVLDTLELVRHHEPVPPRSLQPKLSKDLETICLKCLNKNPAQRYASARELAEDVGRFLEGEAITARSLSPLEMILNEIRRGQIDSRMLKVGTQALLLSPIPFLIHLALFLTLRSNPRFDVMALATSSTCMAVMVAIMLFLPRGVHRAMPTSMRRQLRATWAANVAASTILPFLAWKLGIPWLAVYALWFLIAATTFFSLTSTAGILYVSSAGCLACCLLATFFPQWSPLVLGTFMSANMAYQGWLLRMLGSQNVVDHETGTPL